MTDRRALLDVRRRPSTEDDEWHASWTELFFDLVFVLVVTQLSAHLHEHLSLRGAAETLFLLLVAWWAWLYTTWATNWFDPERGPVRAVLVLAMLASMLGAVAIPGAFDGGELVTLAAGPALYLLGSVAFKVRVYRDLWRPRGVAVVVVIATAALGASLPALAIWTLMLATLVGVAIAEARQARRNDPLYEAETGRMASSA